MRLGAKADASWNARPRCRQSDSRGALFSSRPLGASHGYGGEACGQRIIEDIYQSHAVVMAVPHFFFLPRHYAAKPRHRIVKPVRLMIAGVHAVEALTAPGAVIGATMGSSLTCGLGCTWDFACST